MSKLNVRAWKSLAERLAGGREVQNKEKESSLRIIKFEEILQCGITNALHAHGRLSVFK